MTTLEDAWAWYQSARDACGLLAALAVYWDDFPWDQMRPPNDRLKRTQRDDLRAVSAAVKNPLDDLAVLVLFSVFESIVRREILEQIQSEADAVRHPALKAAVADARSAVEYGSFFRVLDPYKTAETADVLEGVNQVRRYRNWVAHGRRQLGPDEQLAAVDPETAYQRLRDFLLIVRGPQPGPAAEDRS